eukprot:NODE_6811_length_498_cov_32.652291_g6645_i0.p2 GENE.NODE_6811_length_498_cov_32.652291_g6645_i0~~NODE_6811_length_498_cov_32.652291_g6645_i0.p2  ORF type:complete len:129 (+),score=40.38 NODE_6811_length_498_cov_32.652291_g6645_i0:53-439(+)
MFRFGKNKETKPGVKSGSSTTPFLSSGPKGPVEHFIEKLATARGVKGLIITDAEGLPLRDTFNEADSALMQKHASLFSQLIHRTKQAVGNLDEQDELNLVRVRTRKNEYMIALDAQYILIVIQDPNPM